MSVDVSLQTPEGMLLLLQFKGVGPQTAIRIAKELPESSQVFEASDEHLKRLVTPAALRSLRDEDEWQSARDAALNEITRAEAKEVRIALLLRHRFSRVAEGHPRPASDSLRERTPSHGRSQRSLRGDARTQLLRTRSCPPFGPPPSRTQLEYRQWTRNRC